MSSLRPYKVKRDFRSGVVGSKLRLDDSKLDSFCTVDGGEAGDTIVGKDMDETGVILTHYTLVCLLIDLAKLPTHWGSDPKNI